MVYPSVITKNKQMYDCTGWVTIRHSWFSPRTVWYMRLLGSTLTLHQAIDKPIVWEYSVISCKLTTALLPWTFTLTLEDGNKLRVSCDSKNEANMWKDALMRASTVAFHNEFQLMEAFQSTKRCSLFDAVDKFDHSRVTVQRITKDAAESSELAITQACSRQLYSVRSLRHYNLMGAAKVFNEVGFSYIVTRSTVRKRLIDVISEKGGALPEGMARIITIQLVQALQFMHAKGFVHRNVALDTIWYDGADPSDPRVILSSFEHVAFVDDEEDLRMCDEVGNALYLAPEMLSGTSYSAAVDLFALGVCVYRMLSGSYTFGGRHQLRSKMVEARQQGLNFEEQVWGGISSEAKAFVKRLLDPWALSRLTASGAEDDKWFRLDLPVYVERQNEEKRNREPEKGESFGKETGPQSNPKLCKVHRVKAVVANGETTMSSDMHRMFSPFSEEAPQSMKQR